MMTSETVGSDGYNSGYDSSLIWSDDPEDSYFRSMQKAGTIEAESVMGDSTLAEMIEAPTVKDTEPVNEFGNGLSWVDRAQDQFRDRRSRLGGARVDQSRYGWNASDSSLSYTMHSQRDERSAAASMGLGKSSLASGSRRSSETSQASSAYTRILDPDVQSKKDSLGFSQPTKSNGMTNPACSRVPMSSEHGMRSTTDSLGFSKSSGDRMIANGYPESVTSGKNTAYPESVTSGKNTAYPESATSGKNSAYPSSVGGPATTVEQDLQSTIDSLGSGWRSRISSVPAYENVASERSTRSTTDSLGFSKSSGMTGVYTSGSSQIPDMLPNAVQSTTESSPLNPAVNSRAMERDLESTKESNGFGVASATGHSRSESLASTMQGSHLQRPGPQEDTQSTTGVEKSKRSEMSDSYGFVKSPTMPTSNVATCQSKTARCQDRQWSPLLAQSFQKDDPSQRSGMSDSYGFTEQHNAIPETSTKQAPVLDNRETISGPLSGNRPPMSPSYISQTRNTRGFSKSGRGTAKVQLSQVSGENISPSRQSTGRNDREEETNLSTRTPASSFGKSYEVARTETLQAGNKAKNSSPSPERDAQHITRTRSMSQDNSNSFQPNWTPNAEMSVMASTLSNPSAIKPRDMAPKPSSDEAATGEQAAPPGFIYLCGNSAGKNQEDGGEGPGGTRESRSNKLLYLKLGLTILVLAVGAAIAMLVLIIQESSKQGEAAARANISPTSPPLTFPPAWNPSSAPTKNPTISPTSKFVSPVTTGPTRITRDPTAQPTRRKPETSNPTTEAQATSIRPTTLIPSKQPTMNPTGQPTVIPSKQPTMNPTGQPTVIPSKQPTMNPTGQPTVITSKQPTMDPTGQPTVITSKQPTMNPTRQPATLTPAPLQTPLPTPAPVPAPLPTPLPTFLRTSSPTSSEIVFASALLKLISVTPQSAASLGDSTSPQFRALDWMVKNDASVLSLVDSDLFQRWAIITTYFSLGGESWVNSMSWLSSVDECGWHGITCNVDGSISGIVLNSNNLRGTIPRELFLASNMVNLRLASNAAIQGGLPSELGLLTKLRVLELHGNLITGPLPVQLGNLSQLKEFSINYNDMTGSIPDEFSSLVALEQIDLSYNRLAGAIPASLQNLSALTSLKIERNDLVGTIPSDFCGRIPRVQLAADCEEILCPCCTDCCKDNLGCLGILEMPIAETSAAYGDTSFAPLNLSAMVTASPTKSKASVPSSQPSTKPTRAYSSAPSDQSLVPSQPPTVDQPQNRTKNPTIEPGRSPTLVPTRVLTTSAPSLVAVASAPTKVPPVFAPSVTAFPTRVPTTLAPTVAPVVSATTKLSRTFAPTKIPTSASVPTVGQVAPLP